jgi:hypothetical protein
MQNFDNSLIQEQLHPNLADRRIGHWSNVWAFGATMYELITGETFQQRVRQQTRDVECGRSGSKGLNVAI